MHARKNQEYHVIISSPKDHNGINGGCAEKELSPKLKSPDPFKKGPHQKQSQIMKSRGIKVEKDSFHGGPPGLPKAINTGALSPQIQKFPHAHYKNRNNSSLTWECPVYYSKFTCPVAKLSGSIVLKIDQ
ncbi:hypothetical protein O181_107389 [Austropuccinia psidii MF-1]|uniref:Uncharacterized protein n=1 Tax=Austropuccinia psidii MF-1 TaxID=1389203 RepID=A0A9Q3JT06_9BASI|nr:hypothetical protein [Austropuccinia psidii MF-1]